jgi:Leucine-rich repeat (LRR) protein
MVSSFSVTFPYKISPNFFQILLYLLYCVVVVSCEEIYENSTKICTTCTCSKSDDAQVLTLNCTDRSLTHMWASWPPHNTTIRATFTRNNFTSLQKLPPTDASVEVVFSNCNIQYLYPGVFESTINLMYLDLSYNQLTAGDISSDNFRGPYSGTDPESIALEHLNLAYNKIHTLYKNVFQFLPKLKRLNLEGNDFVVLDVQTQAALGKVPGLLVGISERFIGAVLN